MKTSKNTKRFKLLIQSEGSDRPIITVESDITGEKRSACSQCGDLMEAFAMGSYIIKDLFGFDPELALRFRYSMGLPKERAIDVARSKHNLTDEDAKEDVMAMVRFIRGLRGFLDETLLAKEQKDDLMIQAARLFPHAFIIAQRYSDEAKAIPQCPVGSEDDDDDMGEF